MPRDNTEIAIFGRGFSRMKDFPMGTGLGVVTPTLKAGNAHVTRHKSVKRQGEIRGGSRLERRDEISSLLPSWEWLYTILPHIEVVSLRGIL